MTEYEILQAKYETVLDALMDLWRIASPAMDIAHATTNARRQNAIAETIAAVKVYDLVPDILELEAALAAVSA
jgi:hypothetical protein